MPEIEKRVDDLETLLGRFIVHTDIALTNLSREIDRLSKEIDRVGMKVEALSEEMRVFKEEAERDRKALHEKTEAFKDEMKAFKDEMKEFKEEMREETRKKNKEWSNLAKKMGTIVEDLIAPALRPVLKKYFNCDVNLEGQRLFRRMDGETYEVDAIAACDDKVFMIEVRSTPRDRDIDEIKEKAERFFYFFPEFRDRSLILIFGSITFPENIIRYATRSGIYVMGWREWEYMDILNFDKINKK